MGQDWQQRPGSEVGGGTLTAGPGVPKRGRQAHRSLGTWPGPEKRQSGNKAGKLLGRLPAPRWGSGFPAGTPVRVSVVSILQCGPTPGALSCPPPLQLLDTPIPDRTGASLWPA